MEMKDYRVIKLLHSRFEPIVDLCASLVPDGFIYLRAQPDTCMDRMRKRSRNEETGVGMDYLQDLHGRHEMWLNNELSRGDEVNYKQVRSLGMEKPYNGSQGLHLILLDSDASLWVQTPLQCSGFDR